LLFLSIGVLRSLKGFFPERKNVGSYFEIDVFLAEIPKVIPPIAIGAIGTNHKLNFGQI
jgi:hypothetical protein